MIEGSMCRELRECRVVMIGETCDKMVNDFAKMEERTSSEQGDLPLFLENSTIKYKTTVKMWSYIVWKLRIMWCGLRNLKHTLKSKEGQRN